MSTQLIERFLTENSELITSNVHTSRIVKADLRTQRRPDLIYGANGQMKWAMILNGIDSPYMMDNGKVLVVPDATELSSELAELGEFEF